MEVAIFLVIYFVPGLIALVRRHNRVNAIFLVNALLGWTAIGWIAALIWACLPSGKRRESSPQPSRS